MDPSLTTEWMSLLRDRLLESFGDRVVFIGLQGSRARGEAHDDSDIDAVVVLDSVSMDDLLEYRSILDDRLRTPWRPPDGFGGPDFLVLRHHQSLSGPSGTHPPSAISDSRSSRMHASPMTWRAPWCSMTYSSNPLSRNRSITWLPLIP